MRLSLFFTIGIFFSKILSAQDTCAFNPIPSNICPGSDLNLVITNPLQGHVYTWVFSSTPSLNMPNLTGNTVTVAIPFSGSNVNLTVQVLDSLGNALVCSSTQSIQVNYAPNIEIGLVPGQSGLNYDPVTQTISACNQSPPITVKVLNKSSNAGQIVSYQVDWGDGSPIENYTNSTFGGAVSIQHTYIQGGTFPIMITGTGANGCVWTESFRFFNGSNPGVGLTSLGNTVELCAPTELNFLISGTSNNTPGTQYQFFLNNQPISGGFFNQSNIPTEFAYNFTQGSCGEPNNVFAITIQAYNPCGFLESTVQPITVNSAPFAGIGMIMPPTLCPGAVVTYTNDSWGASILHTSPSGVTTCDSTTSIIWEMLNGVLGVNYEIVSGNLFSDQITIRYLTPGTFTIQQTAFNASSSCGSGVTTKTIQISNPPVAFATASFPAVACAPFQMQLNSQSQFATGYIWSAMGPGTVGFLPSPQVPNPIVSISGPGTYTLKLTVSNSCGSSTWDTTIVVFANPSVVVNPIPALCTDNPNLTFLSSQVIFGNGTDPAPTYFWSFPDGIPNTSTSQFPSVTFPNIAGSYPYSVTITNVCDSSVASGNITVQAPQTVNIATLPIKACKNDPAITLVATPASGTWTCAPSVAGAITGGNKFNPSNVPPGVYTLTYTYGNGTCISTASISAEVFPIPMVDAGPNINSCLSAGSITLNPTPQGPGGVWTPATFIVGNVFTPPPGGGSFNLLYTFTDSNACTASDPLLITIGNAPVQALDTFYCDDNSIVGLPYASIPGMTYTGMGVLTGNQLDLSQWQLDTILLHFVFDNGTTCNFSDSIQVAIQPPIAPGTVQAGPDRTLCFDDVIDLNGVGTPNPGSFVGPGIVATGMGFLFDASLAGPGTHTIRYQYGTGSNCGATDTAYFTVLYANVSVNPNTAAYCLSDAPDTLSGGSPMPGVWSGTGITNDIFYPAVAGLGAHPATYTHVVSQNGVSCPFVATRNITVNNLPIPNFNILGELCENNPLTFDNQSTGGINWLWTFSDGQTSTLPSPVKSFPPGSHWAKLEAFSGANCLDSMIRTFVIRPLPTVSLSVNQTEGCGPLNIILTATNAETDVLTMTLDSAGVTTTLPGIANSLTLLPGVDTVLYTITLMGQSNCGQVQSNVTVLVLPQPIASFYVSNNTPCSGTAFEVGITSIGHTKTSTLQTSMGTTHVFDHTANPPTPIQLTFYTDTVVTVSLMLVSENDCGKDTAFNDITLMPTNVAAVIGTSKDTTHVCVGDTVKLFSISTPFAFVHWTDGLGNTFTGDTLLVVPSGTGTYAYTLYAEGCGKDSAIFLFDVAPLPTLSVTTPEPLCPGEIGTFIISSNAAGYTLFFPDGTSAQTQTAEKSFHLPPGNYPVTAIATSAPDGCMNNWSGTLQMLAAPEAIIAPLAPVCKNQPMILQSNSIGAISCVWSLDGLTRDGCSISHTFQNTGQQTIGLHVVTAEGCSDDTVALVVVLTTPTADFGMALPMPACGPGDVLFTNLSTNFTDLEWRYGDGTTEAGTLNPTHKYQQPGVFTATLIASKDGLCFDTTAKVLQLYPKPSLDFILRDTCTRAEGVTLLVNTAPNNHVNLSGPNGYDSPGDFHPGLLPGTYQLRVQTQEGCFSDTSIIVWEPNELELSVTQDSFEILLGQTVEFEVQPNQNGVTFAWYPATGLDSPTSSTTDAKPVATTLYTVIATNLHGCTKQETIYVGVSFDPEALLFIPTAFSPNGDGTNDVFMVRSGNPAVVELAFLRIYDIWNELMFESEPGCQPNDPDSNCGWDGNFKGRPAQMASYRYEVGIRYFGQEEKPFIRTGQFMLVR